MPSKKSSPSSHRRDPPSRPAHILCVVQLDTDRLAIDRNGFTAAMQTEGAGLGLHFTAIHHFSSYRRRLGNLSGELPVASRASERIFPLPLYPSLSSAEVDRVLDVLEQTVRAHRR